MGISSRKAASLVAALLFLTGCATSVETASPAANAAPEPEQAPARHPIAPGPALSAPEAASGYSDGTGPEVTAPNATAPRGPNVTRSRVRDPDARRRVEFQDPYVYQVPTPGPRVEPRRIDPSERVPRGTIDTRPGTIRPPYLEVPDPSQ